MYNKSRLSSARRRRGLTKKQLAEAVGLDPRSITAFESGEFTPGEDTLHKIAHSLSFPLSFFFGDDLDEPPKDGVSFRSMARMTARQRDAALAAGAIAFLLNEWTEHRFRLLPPDLLDLRHETPESAAVSLRHYWGIGEHPIKNIIHVLEAKGVRVFSLAENCRELDAYSLWKDGQPFVFLNTNKTPEHNRFNAAHELGHLVLHQHGAPVGQEAEKEANSFASAFLMPLGSIKAEEGIIPSLPYLIKLKRKWSVSLSALVYRLHKLGIIGDWHNRTLCIEIRRRYGHSEPNGIPMETSQVWDQVFTQLRSEGVTKDHIADQLDVMPQDIEMLVFHLVTMGVSSSSPVRKTARKTDHLRLVS